MTTKEKRLAHNTYMRDYYHRKQKEVYAVLGDKCSICGSLYNLEIDHVNGYENSNNGYQGRGGWQNLNDVLKMLKEGRKNELRILCKDCNLNERFKKDEEK